MINITSYKFDLQCFNDYPAFKEAYKDDRIFLIEEKRWNLFFYYDKNFDEIIGIQYLNNESNRVLGANKEDIIKEFILRIVDGALIPPILGNIKDFKIIELDSFSIVKDAFLKNLRRG